MPRILTVTLNPALDQTTEVARLVEGAKMRCAAPRLDPGGGGANVSRALGRFGRDSLAFICVGGALGGSYRALAEAQGLAAHWHEVAAETRQSLAVHDRAGGGQYRFVLPGAPWSDTCWQGALAALSDLAGAGDLVVLSGSQPAGVPADFPRRLCAALQPRGARVVVDTSGPALFDAAMPNTGAHVLRMDRHEGAELMGRPEIGLAEAAELARALVDRGAARIAIVTVGGDGAAAATPDGAWRVSPPLVEVVSSTGAGDSFVAGLCAGLSQDQPFEDALAFAMAAAADAVTTPATELCTLSGTQAMLEGVTRARL